MKKLSRMIKYTIPKGMTMIPKSKGSKVERKSLKDKMMDNDFTNFLKERRAVSEARFKTMDNKSRSPSPGISRHSDGSVLIDFFGFFLKKKCSDQKFYKNEFSLYVFSIIWAISTNFWKLTFGR